MNKLKRLFSAGKPIPALLLIFGIIIAFNGAYYAMGGRVDFFIINFDIQNETITVIPTLLLGSLLWIIGSATAGVNYLLYSGKLRL